MHGAERFKILEGNEISRNIGAKFVKSVNVFRVNSKDFACLLLSLNKCSILL